jgi:DNA-binding transcriptional LysR family regulator
MATVKGPRRTARRENIIDPISVARAVVVGDCLSFRRAAKLLGIQQSALSRSVGTLEDRLGVSLFERHRGGVRLTNAGAHFLQQARDALTALDNAAVTARAAGAGTLGYLNIGIVSSIAAGYLHDLIGAYTAEHPGIVIGLREGAGGDHVELVRSRRLDVAFVLDTVEVADCDVTMLWSERIFVVLPQDHVLRSKETIDWRDVRNERLIVRRPESDPALCYQIIQRLRIRNHTPSIQKLEVGRETMMHLVAMGRGVGLTSEATAGISFPGIIFRPIAGTDTTLCFCAVWSPHNDNPALRRFLSLARELARRQKKGRLNGC